MGYAAIIIDVVRIDDERIQVNIGGNDSIISFIGFIPLPPESFSIISPSTASNKDMPVINHCIVQTLRSFRLRKQLNTLQGMSTSHF